VLAHHKALDRGRVDAQLGRDLYSETQRVDRRTRAEHAVLSRECAGQIGERIGRVGDREEHRLRRLRDDPRDDIPVDRRVRVEQLQPSAVVRAVRRAAALLVHARADQYDTRAGKVAPIACGDICGR
jgi:hypothetical protein